MTAMSPLSLFLASHIVEPSPSANLAGLPLAGVPGVTRPVSMFRARRPARRPILADGRVRGGQRPEDLLLRATFGTMASPLRNHGKSQHLLILV